MKEKIDGCTWEQCRFDVVRAPHTGALKLQSKADAAVDGYARVVWPVAARSTPHAVATGKSRVAVAAAIIALRPALLCFARSMRTPAPLFAYTYLRRHLAAQKQKAKKLSLTNDAALQRQGQACSTRGQIAVARDLTLFVIP